MFQRKPQRQIKSNQQKSLSRKHSHSPHHRGSTKVRQVVRVLPVRPEENVGCGCKTAKSAIRYMHLLKHRYGAIISQSIYDRIKFDADRGV